MRKRLLKATFFVASFGAVSVLAQDNSGSAASTATGKDLDALKAQLAQQQEQINKLQKTIAEQQKLLERTLENATTGQQTESPQQVAAAARPVGRTGDGTAIVPAVSITPRPDIVNMPRMGGQHEQASPLSVSIGNSTFTPYGFIDFIGFGRSSNTGTGVGTGFTSIPYNNSLIDHISEFNESLQNTRLGLRVDANYLGVKVLGNVEMDFLGNQPSGIFQTSNSDVLRMRLAFVDLQKGKFELLAGQSWSMFTAGKKGLSALTSDVFYSQAVDTNYLSGLVWARQSQVRLIVHPNKALSMGVSFENPQQFIGGGVTLPSAYSSQLATELNNGSTTYTAPNLHPDIIGKVAVDAGRAHLEAGLLFRDFKIATSAGKPIIYSTHQASAVSGQINGNFGLTSHLRLIANTAFGSGNGRYIGGTGPDLVVRSDGSISPVHSYSTTDGIEANPTKNSLLYAYYSGAEFNKNSALDADGKTLIGYGFKGSSLSDNKTIQEFTLGFSPTFWKNANYGAFLMNFQYSYLLRDPWSVPAAGPKSAHTNIYYIDIRYVLP